MFTWEQNEIPNQGVVSNFQGLTYEIGPNPWGNFRLTEHEYTSGATACRGPKYQRSTFTSLSDL